MQNRVGQQFGTYRLLSLLGKGGFAEVYLGEHIYMESKAAIKVLHGEVDPANAQGFLKEARTLASLEHQNIVGIKDFNLKDGTTPFLVMTYASNGTLRKRYPSGQRVPLGKVIPYVQQIAEALQYAHDRRIVHRDLKPENMLISDSGKILLSDFGLAVTYSSTRAYGSAGTYFYMAPEQIEGRPGPASDQYALGVTVYEWLCGSVPFNGSPSEIATQHLKTFPLTFRERGVMLAPQVENVVMRALAKIPQQRYPSIREFALDLQSSSQTRHYASIPSLDASSRHTGLSSLGTSNRPDNRPSLSTGNKPGSMPSFGASSHGSIMHSPAEPGTPSFSVDLTPSRSPTQLGPAPRATLPMEQSTPRVVTPPAAYPPTQPAETYCPPSNARNVRACLVTSLISVVFVLALGFGGFFGISWFVGRVSSFLHSYSPGGPTIPGGSTTPEQVISDFCSDLGGPNYQAAYNEYSTQLQSQISFTDFENYWSGNNAQYHKIDRCDHQTIPTPSGSSITAPWSTHEFFSSQEQNYNVTFVLQGSEWKIDQITPV